MTGLETRHDPSSHRPVLVRTQNTNNDACLDVVPSSEVQLGGLNGPLENYCRALIAALDLIANTCAQRGLSCRLTYHLLALHIQDVAARNVLPIIMANTFDYWEVAVEPESMRGLDVNELLENYDHAQRNATLYLVRGIIDHIERRYHALAASDGAARPGVHSEPSNAAASGGCNRNDWASATRLFRGGGGANNPPDAGHSVARTSVHSEPSASIIYGVGDGDAAAGGGGANNPPEAGDGVARPSVHSEPSASIIYGVGNGDAATGGAWHRNGWASASRLFRGGGGANNPPEAGDGIARTDVHSEPITIIISQVGDGDAAAGGGWRRNVWASANRLFRGWGSANNPLCMLLWRKLSNTLSILGVGDINNLKGGSLALSLIPFFVDKQPPLNTQDKIYMGIAFCCGISAFIIVPLRVPGAESTRVARNRQAIGVTFLIIGVVMFMVTAVDEKLRLLVLFLVLTCLLFSLYLEKREANETQLLPL